MAHYKLAIQLAATMTKNTNRPTHAFAKNAAKHASRSLYLI